MKKLMIAVLIALMSINAHAEYTCSTDRERFDASQMACNVASYISMMCTSVQAVTNAFTYTWVIPCAAPIALADSLCAMARHQREQFQDCRYKAPDQEPKGMSHALVRYIRRHELTMNVLDKYADLAVDVAMDHLKDMGVDPMSDEGQDFLTRAYMKAKELTDKLIQEETEEFEFPHLNGIKKNLNQSVISEKTDL